MHVDLHMHTTISDGVLTPTQLVDLVALNGVHVMALTDHDTTNGLQEAFAALGQPLRFGGDGPRQAQARSSCFASGTAADLVHLDGAKRIGSAQLWRGPALLQHGSLLLQPDIAAREHLVAMVAAVCLAIPVRVWQYRSARAAATRPPTDRAVS